MTDEKSPEPGGFLPDSVLQYLRRDLDLLDSPSAHWRMRGIQAVAEQGRYEAVNRLVELLDDDSPIIWDGLVTEVRMCALSGLQRLHHAAKLPLELGPVAVRRAWPVAEMRAAYQEAIAGLSQAERRDLLARADAALASRVQPEPEQADDARAYRVLQELGRVRYERQRPDPRTTLTPLQETIYAEQVAAPRPRPCLRVAPLDRPDATLGWIYRDPVHGRWVHDFSDHPEARDASEALSRILDLGARGIPRVAHDGAGRPVRSADGKFVLDGELPLDSGDEVDSLRSIGALMSEFSTELLLPEGRGR